MFAVVENEFVADIVELVEDLEESVLRVVVGCYVEPILFLWKFEVVTGEETVQRQSRGHYIVSVGRAHFVDDMNRISELYGAVKRGGPARDNADETPVDERDFSGAVNADVFWFDVHVGALVAL